MRVTRSLLRWGLRSIVGGVTAAGLARLTARPAYAADSNPLILGARNDAQTMTTLEGATDPEVDFEARELQGGTSDVRFSYRVMAKRGDIARQRLERVAAPSPIEPPRWPRPARGSADLVQSQ
jgi:hypothetical protein